jgi:hypothetical protein
MISPSLEPLAATRRISATTLTSFFFFVSPHRQKILFIEHDYLVSILMLISVQPIGSYQIVKKSRKQKTQKQYISLSKQSRFFAATIISEEHVLPKLICDSLNCLIHPQSESAPSPQTDNRRPLTTPVISNTSHYSSFNIC